LSLLVIGSIAYVNPGVALLGAIGVAAIYWIFYRTIRSRVERNGRRQHELGAGRIAVVEQALLGIKYVQIARAQLPFARRFEALTRALSHHRADTQFLAYFPRYLLECAAGAALIVCAAFASRGASSGVWLAQLSFIGFAGFRLLPAIQQIYSAFVFIRASQPAVANIAAELGACVVPARELAPPAHQPLAQGVDLLGVSFRYSAQGPLVLDNASLHIAAGSVTGIVGASGCGKTTLIDLILGLLTPTEGRIVIDGAPLDAARVASWQASIGYVPQDITVLDATVRENIAFGVEAAAIDDARVREVATLAGAVGFIESLPGGFEAPLSGVGGGLSGGQRQRIAIARALYRDPALLVLDEATNALDAETEAAIIDAVMRNRGTRTLLIVAHGAAVIGACERVLELRQGVLASRPVGVPDAGGRAAEYSRG
jgi:ABC-type multidrug transport system fused ATPase/permease subunit